MVKVTNIFGDTYSGAAGKAGVFAKWKGRQYRRAYVIPANPRTTMQQVVRASFTNAVSFWHRLSSIQRLAFAYLATGLVMSGFNYLVSLWQKAATKGLPVPVPPVQGIKQVCTDSAPQSDSALTADNPFHLGYGPIQIGSLIYIPGGTDTNHQDAYIDLDMGDVRIPNDITNTRGAAGGGQPIAPDDQLCISYKSRGRTITREVLYTVPAGANSIPKTDTIAQALRTNYWPIDMGTPTSPLKLEIYDASSGTYHHIESLEILNLADPAVIYFDKTRPAHASSKVDYVSYTPLAGAKLETVKADTSFVTWRRYADTYGAIPIAQSPEAAPYDWTLTAPGYVSVIRAAQDAVLAAQHELIKLVPEV